jgi:hypothetical protein
MRPRRSWRERLLSHAMTGIVVFAMLAITAPVAVPWAKEEVRAYTVSRPDYKRASGSWSTLAVPAEFRINAVHGALLRTGKVLMIAGSGNDETAFKAGSFKSLLWDPNTGEFKTIATPTDLFCSGHVQLPDGRLLIAGGTQRYEKLADKVQRAAGPIAITNESPADTPFVVAKGTIFTSPDGKRFRSKADVTVLPAEKTVRAGHRTRVKASYVEVMAEAVQAGAGSVIDEPFQYSIAGLARTRARNVYATADKLTREKQEFQGDDKSYLFDPATERYERVDNLTLKRWYPTLVGLEDGKTLAVSGLDGFGRIIDGDNEVYDPRTRLWEDRPDLKRTFPTYPSLFLLGSGKLFYSGSNAGYGSATEGRTPGVWDLDDNSFVPTPGLRQPTLTETSSSVLLPPAQQQKVMLAGGGGVGDSHASTARTDIADLSKRRPRFSPGPDLPAPTRYCNLVVTPDDRVFMTGGSRDYRGRANSDNHNAQFYDPKTNALTQVASPVVGRNYHATALLLPDGRIMTMGSDPLYSAKGDAPGTFEKRIEIYTPAYLYKGEARPRLTGGPTVVERGQTKRFTTSEAQHVLTARLVRPSAVTHVTDPDQRSIALDVTREAGAVALKLPERAGLVPSGWYMLFVNDDHGVPSEARWVRVR